MTEDPEALARRVAALENQVEELRARLDRLRTTDAPRPAPAPPAPAPEPVAARGFRMEDWIDRLGIALLLVGAGVLLKYSYDQGWLVPAIRVGLVAAVGVALQLIGWAIRSRNRRLAAILLGGSIAALYAAPFAAYQLYALFDYAWAFGVMVGVTALAFVLGTTQRQPLLAIIGAFGGFATPLVLYTGSARASGLGIYVALLLLGTTAIYLARRWDALLLVSSVGAWAVLAAAAFAVPPPASWDLVDQGLLHVGVLAAGFATGLAPAAGTLSGSRQPGGVALGLMVATPLAAVVVCRLFVESDRSVALATLGLVAAGYVVALIAALRSGPPRSPSAAALLWGAFGLTGLTVILALDGPVGPIALALGAAGLVGAGRGEWGLRALGLVLLMGLLAWSAPLLVQASENTPFSDGDALQLAATVLALAIVGRLEPDAGVRSAALQLANGVFLATLLRELRPLADGDLVTTAIWGAYGLLLLGFGLLRSRRQAQIAGLIAVVVASAKLLLVDLETTTTVWRVALLMGIGSVLLLMSYVAAQRRSN